MQMGWTALAVAAALCAATATAAAQTRMFKCGSNYQDRPCADQEVQKRYAPAAGRFDVEQVNPDTDRDCAQAAAEALPLWQRAARGEPAATPQQAEMRELLLSVQGFKGTPAQARSQLEAQCMAAKRSKGRVTERELADARAAGRASQPGWIDPRPDTSFERAMIEHQRAEAAAARAAALAARRGAAR